MSKIIKIDDWLWGPQTVVSLVPLLPSSFSLHFARFSTASRSPRTSEITFRSHSSRFRCEHNYWLYNYTTRSRYFNVWNSCQVVLASMSNIQWNHTQIWVEFPHSTVLSDAFDIPTATWALSCARFHARVSSFAIGAEKDRKQPKHGIIKALDIEKLLINQCSHFVSAAFLSRLCAARHRD